MSRNFNIPGGEALQELAQQLLLRLGEGGKVQVRTRTRMTEGAKDETAARSEMEFLDYEKESSAREFMDAGREETLQRQFLQAQESGQAQREFPQAAARAVRERYFIPARAGERLALAEDMGHSGGQAAEFLADGYAEPAMGSRHRQMEEISEFFRRDGRKYDNGFEQY